MSSTLHPPASVILVFGASGAGTSTFARLLTEFTNEFVMLDIDDYFWIPSDPPFSEKRSKEDCVELIRESINLNLRLGKKVIVSGSLCGWGDDLIPLFDLVIRINTPTPIRIERLKEREFRRFGKRIEPDGDMRDNFVNFIDWAIKYDTGDVSMRSKARHDAWQKKLPCQVLELDGKYGTAALADVFSKSFFTSEQFSSVIFYLKLKEIYPDVVNCGTS